MARQPPACARALSGAPAARQALEDRRLVAVEAAAEADALAEWAGRFADAGAALAAPGLPLGMRAEVAALFAPPGRAA